MKKNKRIPASTRQMILQGAASIEAMMDGMTELEATQACQYDPQTAKTMIRHTIYAFGFRPVARLVNENVLHGIEL